MQGMSPAVNYVDNFKFLILFVLGAAGYALYCLWLRQKR